MGQTSKSVENSGRSDRKLNRRYRELGQDYLSTLLELHLMFCIHLAGHYTKIKVTVVKASLWWSQLTTLVRTLIFYENCGFGDKNPKDPWLFWP